VPPTLPCRKDLRGSGCGTPIRASSGEREQVAEDVTQEAFLRAFRFLGGFRGDRRFGSWLFSIVRNCSVDALRRQRQIPVPWDESTLGYHMRLRKKHVRSPSYEEVARPIYSTSIGRWRNYERQIGPLMDRLAPLVKALGYEVQPEG
jgi:RNA polymerase sigma factor (sigma-70 family)